MTAAQRQRKQDVWKQLADLAETHGGFATPPRVDYGEISIGPRTHEDRLGYTLYRKPDLFANPDFLNDAAKVFLKARMPQGVRWLEAGARVQRENWPKAMQLLSAGDAEGAEEAFNSTGRVRVVPGSTKELGEGKWQVKLESGETKVFEPLKYMWAMLSPKEFFRLDMKRKKLEFGQHRRRKGGCGRTFKRKHGAEMSAAGARHMARVRVIGCLLCLTFGWGATPAEAHHIGDSAERNDFLTVPLCAEHHRGATGFHGLGEREFNRRYKTSELKLLALTLERLEKNNER